MVILSGGGYVMFFTIVSALAWNLFYAAMSILIVEGSGYAWHRLVSHEGYLGNHLIFPHWVHHMIKYPTGNTRTSGEYQQAGDWTFYLLYFLCCFTVGILVPVGLLNGKNYLIMFVTASTWGYIGQSYFHTIYHLPKHWLHQFQLFQRLMQYHDIHHYGPWNYGITFFWFDRVAGTLQKEIPRHQQELFPHTSEQLKAAWTRRAA